MSSPDNTIAIWGDSIITSRPWVKRVGMFFVVLCDRKLGRGWYLTTSRSLVVSRTFSALSCLFSQSPKIDFWTDCAFPLMKVIKVL